MWNSVERSSYEAARRSDEGSFADELTLAGDEDLPLSPEELAFADPMDEKAHVQIGSQTLNSQSNKALSITSRLREWAARPRFAFEPVSSHSPTAGAEAPGEAGVALLAKDEDGQTIVPRWHHAAEHTVSWLIWPLPSFTHRFFVKHCADDDEIHRPTDYLDGMRGFASFIVFIDHYLVGLYDSLMIHGFGEADHFNIFELPFIKVIYCGSAMVAVFFVISGYVLSARCILAMRNNKPDKVYSVLTSMSFRRAIRLFLPSVAVTFLAFLLSLIGILPPPNKNWNVFGELHRYWMFLMEDLFKLWTWEVSYKGWYGNQLWTIPLEFKCSMILFIFILMVARCKAWIRLVVETLTILYLFYRDRWDVATFIAGMFIAELNIIYDERKAARNENLNTPPRRRQRGWGAWMTRTLPLWCIFIAGWYLCGYPIDDAEGTPGYDFLFSLWRFDWEYKWRFWIAVGALMCVFSASFLDGLKWFFSTPPIRYLGKISYALYLVHNITNRTLRFFLWHTFWKVLQYESQEGDDAKYDGGWILGTLIYFPLVFWCADIFWRAVDVPSVRFAKWVEGKSFKTIKTA